MKKGILIVVLLVILSSISITIAQVQETKIVAESKPELTEDQKMAWNVAKKIYEDNLVCYDGDGGINTDKIGDTGNKLEANVFQRIFFILKTFFGGVSRGEIQNTLQEYSDSCDIIYKEEEWGSLGLSEQERDKVELILKSSSDLWLKEYYCDGQAVKYKYYMCSSGCNNGRCIGEGENIRPEIRIKDWIEFSNREGDTSEQIGLVPLRLYEPKGAIFVKTQEEYNYLINPNTPKRRSSPEFYDKYLVLTLKKIETDGSLLLEAKSQGVEYISLLKPTDESKLLSLPSSETEPYSKERLEYLDSISKIIGDYKIRSGLYNPDTLINVEFHDTTWRDKPESVDIPVIVEYLGTMETL